MHQFSTTGGGAVTRRSTLAAILLSLAAAVAPPAQAQNAKVYGKSYDVVWRASLEAARASGLEVLSDDRKKGLIVARSGVSAFGWGESVVINVERASGPNSTRVQVTNKRAVPGNVLGPNWERKLLDDLDQRLSPR
jgi:hypothetical protein